MLADHDKKDKVDSDAEKKPPEFENAALAGFLLAALDANDTMLFTFLPTYFLEHGISLTIVGFFYTLLSVGIFILIPAMPWLMPKVGGSGKTGAPVP